MLGSLNKRDLHFGITLTRLADNYRVNTVSLTLVAAACVLLVSGCDKEYKPAPYKAAPRVDVGESSDSEVSAASNVRLPDVTDWTSPDAIRATRRFAPPKIGRFYGGNSYRGYGGYAGNSRRGYSGIYRGDLRQYRGNAQRSTYRGYGNSGSYRGDLRKPAGNYRGYRQ